MNIEWQLMGRIVKISLQDKLQDGEWDKVTILYNDLNDTPLGLECHSSLINNFDKIEQQQYKSEIILNLYKNTSNIYGYREKYKITP